MIKYISIIKDVFITTLKDKSIVINIIMDEHIIIIKDNIANCFSKLY